MKNHKGFLEWIKDLPEVESPSWSGLPLNVEKLVRERQTVSLIQNMKLLQGTGDDVLTASDDANAENDSKAAWLVKLQHKLDKLLKALPGQLQIL